MTELVRRKVKLKGSEVLGRADKARAMVRVERGRRKGIRRISIL
jgi:hypothetical protein